MDHLRNILNRIPKFITGIFLGVFTLIIVEIINALSFAQLADSVGEFFLSFYSIAVYLCLISLVVLIVNLMRKGRASMLNLGFFTITFIIILFSLIPLMQSFEDGEYDSRVLFRVLHTILYLPFEHFFRS